MQLVALGSGRITQLPKEQLSPCLILGAAANFLEAAVHRAQQPSAIHLDRYASPGPGRCPSYPGRTVHVEVGSSYWCLT